MKPRPTVKRDERPEHMCAGGSWRCQHLGQPRSVGRLYCMRHRLVVHLPTWRRHGEPLCPVPFLGCAVPMQKGHGEGETPRKIVNLDAKPV
jgi:hypothetical protein